MTKSEKTRLALEEALTRILIGNPRRVPQSRKLSVRSVETEAGASNGSAYYYPEVIEKIANHKKKTSLSAAPCRATSVVDIWKGKALEAERLKSKFRNKFNELMLFNAQIAADQYRQMSALQEALQKISDLEKTIESLNEELIKTRRKNITKI